MPIDFPNSPANGATYTVGTKTWQFDGTSWNLVQGDALIGTGSVTSDKIADSAVTTAKIAAGAVVEADIASSAVTTAKIADANVTAAKLHATAAIQPTIVDAKGDLIVGTANDTVARQGVGSNGSVLMADSAQTNGVVWSSAQTSYRNRIINGAFDVWQRGTSFTSDPAANVIYTADRWGARGLYPGFGSTQTITRESTSANVPTGFTYSLKAVVSTAVPENSLRHQIFYTMENIDTMKYAGRTLTVSCQIKAVGGCNRAYIVPQYNTSGGRSVDGTSVVTQTFTVNTSSFTTCTFSFAVPSASTLTATGTLGLVFVYGRATGIEQVGDGIYLGAVQMEDGSVATPFEFEDYGTTLMKCYRYYQENFQGVWGATYASTDGVMGIAHKAPMRANPTLSQKSGVTLSIDIVGGVQTGTMAIAGTGQSDSYTPVTVSGLTGRGLYQPIGIANSGTQLSAEL